MWPALEASGRMDRMDLLAGHGCGGELAPHVALRLNGPGMQARTRPGLLPAGTGSGGQHGLKACQAEKAVGSSSVIFKEDH